MSILDSLFVSVFGLAVVFIVLIFLSLLVRFQSALVSGFSKKRAAAPIADVTHEAAVNKTAPLETKDLSAARTDIPDSQPPVVPSHSGDIPSVSGSCKPAKYTAVLGGKAFEIEIEEIGNTQPVINASAAVKTVPLKQAPVPPPAPTVPAAADNGSEAITAPVPGSVLDIKTSVGAKVKSGDVLLLIEAMKMENEIVAVRDGTVTQILTSKGSAVSAGMPLVIVQ